MVSKSKSEKELNAEGFEKERQRHLSGLRFTQQEYDLWRSIDYRRRKEASGEFEEMQKESEKEYLKLIKREKRSK